MTRHRHIEPGTSLLVLAALFALVGGSGAVWAWLMWLAAT